MKPWDMLYLGGILEGRYARKKAVLAAFCFFLAASGLAPAATLTGSFTPLPNGASVDLSAPQVLDWVYCGEPSEWNTNSRYGVSRQITYSLVTDEYFTDGPIRMETGPVSFTWTNGTPVRAMTDTTNGVSVYGDKLTSNIPTGFEIRCLAGTTPRWLTIYVGTSGGEATLRAALSGTPGYSDTSFDGFTGPAEGVYELRFAADAPGQVLTLNFESADTSGYIFMKAAVLREAKPPPAPFIAAPADGTAYQAPQTFSVTASIADPEGVATNLALFSGTNVLAKTPAKTLTVWLTNPPAGPHTFSAVATDNNGLSITSFPSSVYITTGGGTLLGNYAAPPSRVDLTAEGTLDWAHWGYDGWDGFDHKDGVVSRIPNIELLNTTYLDLWNYGDNLGAFSWQDGTPTAAVVDTTTGVFLSSSNFPTAGFQLTVPATNRLHCLRIYVGVFGAAARLSAWMTDWSAPPWFDTSVSDGYGRTIAVYTLRFASPNPSASLRISWTPIAIFVPEYGNLTWQSATLQLAQEPELDPPTLKVAAPPAPGLFALSFMAASGRKYTVQWAEGLLSPNWQTVTNFTGEGVEVLAVDYPGGSSQRFYRVWVEY
jgi:hypothetical protein